MRTGTPDHIPTVHPDLTAETTSTRDQSCLLDDNPVVQTSSSFSHRSRAAARRPLQRSIRRWQPSWHANAPIPKPDRPTRRGNKTYYLGGLTGDRNDAREAAHDMRDSMAELPSRHSRCGTGLPAMARPFHLRMPQIPLGNDTGQPRRCAASSN